MDPIFEKLFQPESQTLDRLSEALGVKVEPGGSLETWVSLGVFIEKCCLLLPKKAGIIGRRKFEMCLWNFFLTKQ